MRAKKLILSFTILFSFMILFSNVLVVSNAKLTTFYYARVETDGVFLYKNTNPLPQNAYFELPRTYFVLLLSDYNAIFYKAQYRDIVGYVLKDEVSPVAETPQNPYLENHTFYVFSSDGTSVMSSPYENGIIQGVVEEQEKISYYGKIQGYEMTQNRGSTWIYGKTNDGIYGYIYGGLSQSDEIIPQNTEELTPISNPYFDNSDDYLYNLVDLTPGLKIMLVALVSVPSAVILFLMFRPIFPKNKEKSTLKVSKRERKNKTIKQIEDLSDDTTF